MNQKIEIIKFSEKAPLRLYSHNFTEIKSHWHQDIEIILILKGNCTLVTNNRVINLKEEDIFLLNKNIIHEFKSEMGCSLVSLKIDTTKLNNFDNNISFSLDSTSTKNTEVFKKMKFYIAELVKINGSDNEENYLSNLSILYSILYELTTKFKVDEQSIQSSKYVEKLNEILKYIENHYKEGLTFTQISNAFHYSVPYLSSFFSHYLGVTFQNYYKDFRLERAVNELLHTDNSIEEIAVNNGY